MVNQKSVHFLIPKHNLPTKDSIALIRPLIAYHGPHMKSNTKCKVDEYDQNGHLELVDKDAHQTSL